MAYFPFFMELEGRSGLIVGGGHTALGKAKRLLDYGACLTVVAPAVLPELRALPGVTVIQREFQQADLTLPPLFVVAATDSGACNRLVSRLCRERRIPVNVVDAPEDCSFLFPALVRRGALSIGISTGGASPTAAAYLKDRVAERLPEGMGEILAFLQTQREPVKDRVSDGETRKAVFQALFLESLRLGRALTEAETERIIEGS